jgi:predicted NUDIX family NTP pyrophosphohydrolase
VKQSAGILLFRRKKEKEVFLVHPGGPFWMNKDNGAWTIPKGEINETEDPLAAAIREFEEETGKKLLGSFIQLIPVKQKAGKIIQAWLLEDDIDEKQVVSNNFTMEWPPKSGKMKSFPEVDKAAWFSVEAAKEKINPAQIPFVEAVEKI